MKEWIVHFLTPGYIADGSEDWRVTISLTATHETERGDHDFFFGLSHYTDTDTTSGKRAIRAGIEPQIKWHYGNTLRLRWKIQRKQCMLMLITIVILKANSL